MSFIHLANISLAYGDRDIFSSINFQLNTGDRKAVAGVNGSGKSTLLKILAGSISPDTGSVSLSPDTRIGYLPQHGIVHTGKTLIEEADTAFEYFHGLEKKRKDLEHDISGLREGSDILEKLLVIHHDIMEKLNDSGYYYRQGRIESIMTGLGFSRDELSRKTETFSGGWQMRIALGKLLLENPDFMLLDEPTNYLDLEARNWLESFLSGYSGAYCIVSHDRYFLDRTINEVAEIFFGKIRTYSGSYSFFEKERQERIRKLEREYRLQQEEIRKHEEFINRFRYNQSKASLVQSRIKLLEKIVPVDIPPGYRHMSISFPEPPHSGKHMVRLEGICKSYGDNCVLEEISMEIARGEKLVLVGQNGTGKTTLMRIIAGVDTSFTGNMRYGTDVCVGYFSQDFDQLINGPLRIIDYMEQHSPAALVPKIRDMLGSFLFAGDDIHKTLSVLSGGEKSRVALLTLLLSPFNLLVLDEPTNHLDLTSKDILLEALKAYSGTVVFVSHDRDFIERLASRVLNMAETPPKSYPGDYRYFLSQFCPDASTEISINENIKGDRQTDTMLSREERKKNKMLFKRLSEKENALMEQLDEISLEHEEILTRLGDPGIYSDGESIRKLKNRMTELEVKERNLQQEWEDVSNRISLVQTSIEEG